MNFGQLQNVIHETGQSPEQLAEVFDVANMTIRRWLKEPATKKVPKSHQWSILETVYELIQENKLSTHSPAVNSLLKSSTPSSFTAVMESMGGHLSPGKSGPGQQSQVTELLSQIGKSDGHRRDVEKNSEQISSYKKLGEEWKQRISGLWNVVKSTKLTTMDKMVAYGALFYLITPFDLVPDHIPVLGLVDDFGILGFALTYYSKRFPESLDNIK